MISDFWPRNTNYRVVPGQTLIAFCVVIARDLITNDRVGLKRTEPMGKARRNPELLAILRGERLSDPPAISRRTTPDVDGDVIKGAGGATYELALRMRFALEMKTADRARLCASGLVVLDKYPISAAAREAVRAESLREITALVPDVAGSQ